MGGEEMPWRKALSYLLIAVVAFLAGTSQLSLPVALLVIVVGVTVINFAGVVISAWRRWPK
jgi:hypothetical protein